MTTRSERMLLWTPRILGILLAVFVGVFALDAFSAGRPLLRAFAEFTVHIAPALLLLGIVAASWRRAWVGGIGFTALAAAYAMVAWRHVDWILVIAGPALIVGLLFFVSWYSLRYAARRA